MRTQLVGEPSKEYCEPEMEKGNFSAGRAETAVLGMFLIFCWTAWSCFVSFVALSNMGGLAEEKGTNRSGFR